ncbi:MAG: acetate kinase [Tissierellia bacterium]|nr:acetate kinase [Tissierellia bacterium]
MKVLVINSGSSSLKYQLLDVAEKNLIGKGLVERIGIEGSILTQTKNGEKTKIEKPMPSHIEAVQYVFDALTHEDYGLVKSIDEIDAIGHRIVHGGDITDSQVITPELKEKIKEFSKFAPLHNPAGLLGVEACEKIVPGKPNVAVFDTAFHATMEPRNFLYALPYEFYEKYGIRKYGFHGTSHKYITRRTAELLGKEAEDINLLTIHLGNGSSITAVKNGKSIDTTMGLTPLEGLIMGTRSGDLDPAILIYLVKNLGYSIEDVDRILNKESGVLGISGLSSDFRDLEEATVEGNKRAQLALDMFVDRARAYIGSFLIKLGHVDAIAFAGGIGENSAFTRKRLLLALEPYGIELDDEVNEATREEKLISTEKSPIKVFVVPTNEELMIAQETVEVLEK